MDIYDLLHCNTITHYQFYAFHSDSQRTVFKSQRLSITSCQLYVMETPCQKLMSAFFYVDFLSKTYVSFVLLQHPVRN